MSTEPGTRPKRGLLLAALGTALHAALAFALVAVFATYVADAKRAFDDHRMMLPRPVRSVVRLSDVWWFFVPVAGACLVADFTLVLWVRRAGAAHAVVWVLSIAAALALALAATVFVVEWHLAKLREALAR